jgi:hypothetical protein
MKVCTHGVIYTPVELNASLQRTMLLKKVISGGQTGADRAGLVAAQLAGLPTGGTATKGYRTLNGPDYSLRELFGLVEHENWAYPPRTEANARDGDGTFRFAENFDSAGERCTLKFIKKHKKVHFDVDMNNPPDVEEAIEWLVKNKIETLNVAGNSEQTAPGIYDFTLAYLLKVFRGLKECAK